MNNGSLSTVLFAMRWCREIFRNKVEWDLMKIKSLTLCLILVLSSLRAADDAQLATLKAADDGRVAAIQSADKAKLDAVFSDELRYSHSSGNVDTKASYIEALTSGKLKYAVMEYEERNFTFPVPGIALMTGKMHLKAYTPTGVADGVFALLAVWREEKGQWRFLAWQSAKLPPATK